LKKLKKKPPADENGRPIYLLYDRITSREKSLVLRSELLHRVASVIKLKVAPTNRTIVVDVPYAVYLRRETGSKGECVRVISVVYL